MGLPGNNLYQNEFLARLYAEHQSATLKAATTNKVSSSDSNTSQLNLQSGQMNEILVNMFGKDRMDGQGTGRFLPNQSSSVFGGLDSDLEAKAREFAAAAAFAAGGMPSPHPGLLRLSSNTMPGKSSFNEFSAMSARPLAVGNQS